MDPCIGDLEIIDPSNPCNCIVSTPTVLGCTNPSACNFNPAANCDDGSCIFETTCDIDPCTNGGAFIWDATTCSCVLDEVVILGCMNPTACNFDPAANCDDGSCIFETTCDIDPCTNGGIFAWDATTCSCVLDEVVILGCMNPTACNFNPAANCDDGSCIFETTCDIDPCTIGGIFAWDASTCSCVLDEITILGCISPNSCNFDPAANCDDGSCIPNNDPGICNTDCALGNLEIWDNNACLCVVDIVVFNGCTNPSAPNFDPSANCDDGSCDCIPDGCIDPTACNFDPTASCDNGSCVFETVCDTDPVSYTHLTLPTTPYV